jgi:cytochrome c
MFVRRLPVLILTTAAAIEIFASLFIHPYGDVKNSGVRQRPVLQNADVPSDVLKILNGACLNCHSEKTEWPWYSRVAPLSWLVERDVSRARGKMNLSRWEENSAEEKIDLLKEIRAAARTGIMPPRQYTLVHPAAKLSPDQAQEIYNWARAQDGRERDKGDN